MPQRFTVSTYNILSPELCSFEWFPHCISKKCTAPGFRFELVKQKLTNEFKRQSCICLQEVSDAWASKLYPFFEENDYSFVYRSYGSRFNGRMGVGIAYSRKLFRLADCKIVCNSDTKEGGYPRRKRDDIKRQGSMISSFGGLVDSILKRISLLTFPIKTMLANDTQSAAKTKEPESRSAESLWEEIDRKHNACVMLRLNFTSGDIEPASDSDSAGKSVCISTYHMPCQFRWPCVIAAHTSLLLKAVEKFAGKDPYIIAGDFNFKPFSPCYTLVTTGKLPPKEVSKEEGVAPCILPPAYEGDVWNISGFTPLKSAYKEATGGKEPDFTNFAHTRNMETPFVDTLDYIFFNKNATGLKVKNTDTLPSRDSLKDVGSFPTESEPSDHMLLAAEFET